MAEFEDKLNSILSNPALMSQIMAMAGSMGQQGAPQASAPPPSPPPQQPPQSGFSPDGAMGFDPTAMQGLMQLLKSTQIGAREQNLLRALEGYLPHDRIQKLMKAMQAAKVAKFASGALSQGR